MKTFKSLLGMMAVALMAASCSDVLSDNQVPEQTSMDGTIHFTATLAPKDLGATTRALEETSEGLKSYWAKGEEISVKFTTKSNGTQSTKATVSDVDPVSGAATIEADFTNAKDGGDVAFFYPYELATKTNPIEEQDGALSSKLDIRKGSGTLKVVDGEATLASSLKLEAQYAIVSLGLAEVAMDNNLDADKLVIYDGDTKLATVTPSTPTSTPYVALPALESNNLRFWAKAGEDLYFARGTAKLEAGKYYQTGMNLARPGDVIGADGKFYEDAAVAGKSGTTAEAMVAWYADGTDVNGLVYAIALEDYVTSDGKAVMSYRTAQEGVSLSNKWNAKHSMPFGKWELPEANTLALMLPDGGIGTVQKLITQSTFPASIGVRTLSFRTMLTNTLGTNADVKSTPATYWTASTCTGDMHYIWTLDFGGNTEDSAIGYFKSEDNDADTPVHSVRYVLAF